jgi:hypothetical protein
MVKKPTQADKRHKYRWLTKLLNRANRSVIALWKTFGEHRTKKNECACSSSYGWFLQDFP